MQDERGTPTWGQVEEHFQMAYGPAFGKISTLSDLSVVGETMVATGSIMDRLEGRPDLA